MPAERESADVKRRKQASKQAGEDVVANMAETSKRSWPWKKKAHDKATSSPESVSSPRASPQDNTKLGDEQDEAKRLSEHARSSQEAFTQFQQTEVKLKQMSEHFHATQAKLAGKDVLVKQHAKVAEEAVTGWEKAEAEALALKQQLDLTIHQKLATEDRVTHLDGALKECMKQLRHVREEQEQKIHETIVKKTREYDSLRQEMEAKLSEIGRHLHDARSEIAVSKSEARRLALELEESANAFVQVNDLRAHSVDEVRIVQNRFESIEKECSTLKYELEVLKKVLEIRNEEIEAERRVTENASKNQLENVKKIAKLEAEGHRLRILLQKKLPGPAAVAQMKNEVVALENSSRYDPKRRRSLGVPQGSSSSPKDLSRHSHPLVGSSPDVSSDRGGFNREWGGLGERLAEMDDELRMLQEALVKRDGELKESRLMCAKTASKLSNVEEQLQAALKRQWRKRGSASSRSFWMNESVGGGDVDPWDEASALLIELDQVKLPADKGLNAAKMDLMHDFAEMEKLAMTSDEKDAEDQDGSEDGSDTSIGRMKKDFQEKLQDKEKEVDEANRKCTALSQKLLRADEELAALHSRNRANEADLVALQEKLDSFGDRPDDDEGVRDGNITRELEDLVEAQVLSLRSVAADDAVTYDFENENQMGGTGVDDIRGSVSSRTSSDVKYAVQEDLISVLSDAESNGSNVGSALLASVRNFVRVVVALVDATGEEYVVFNFEPQHQNEYLLGSRADSPVNPGASDLTRELRRLMRMCKRLQQGKTDVAPLLANVTAVLSNLLRIIVRNRSGDQVAPGRTILPNHTSDRRHEGELRGPGMETSFQESLSQVDMGSLHALKHKTGNMEEIARSESIHELVEDRGCISAGLQDSVDRSCSDLQECARYGGQEGEEILLVHKKGAAVEGDLQEERLGHQKAFLQYLDVHRQQNLPGDGGSTSTSSADSHERESPIWDSTGSHDRRLSPHSEDSHSTKDRETQCATDKLAECHRSINDLAKQSKTLSACGPPSSDCCDSLVDMAGEAEMVNCSRFDRSVLS